MADDKLDQLCINTIRTLSMDAVQAANSGHPGTPMALAPVAYYLWQRYLRFDPADPDLAEPRPLRALQRPRLDAALQPAAPHRRAGRRSRSTRCSASPRSASTTSSASASSTASAPAIRSTAGRRASRPPPARSARASPPASAWPSPAAGWRRATTSPTSRCSTYDVFAICGDGCLMEGISNEAGSIAGHLQLSNLCWIYDNNHITIEGNTALAYSDDVATRFIGYGWNVTRVGDANDLELLGRALDTFKATDDRPTLIIVDSHIGYGAPNKQDTSAAHGEPLGEDEIRLTKQRYGWPPDAKFLVPDGVYDHFKAGIGARGAELRAAWTSAFARLQEAVPRARRPDRAHAAARAAGGLGPRPADLPRRRQGPRQPRVVEQGAQRGRQERALADRRLGRSHPVDQDAPDLRRRRRLRGRQLRRPQPALRHPRARHVRHPQRHVAGQGAPLRLRLLHLHRLRAARRSA